MNKTSASPRRALGKGLNALLPTRSAPPAHGIESVAELPIDHIDPNPLQPRRVFQSERLEELAQSIRSNGIIQPLVVRPVGERYQLVAGERRWRAAKLAGLAAVPVIVHEFPDDRLLEITLIENIQREDLNPIETAQAFDRLTRELHLSHDEIGRRTGKERTTITNLLRLLNLPPDLQQLVAERRLSAGHARCLLALPTATLQREVAEKSVAQGWSVRQVERVTQRMLENREPKHVDEV
jgi:ParB family transcriptional regulator, chromosome partitioning protein